MEKGLVILFVFVCVREGAVHGCGCTVCINPGCFFPQRGKLLITSEIIWLTGTEMF